MTDADQERGWRESAEAAEAFFQLVGQATVAERLANIASTARAVLHALKTGAHTHAPAAINRWAVRHPSSQVGSWLELRVLLVVFVSLWLAPVASRARSIASPEAAERLAASRTRMTSWA